MSSLFTIIECKEKHSLCTIYDEENEPFFHATTVAIVNKYNNVCNKSWKIIRKVGEPSSNATVYLVQCLNNNKKSFILKITNAYLDSKEQLNEFSTQHHFGELGISVPVYQALFERNKEGKVRLALIMEPLEITVKSYIEQYLMSTPVRNWDYEKIKEIIQTCLSIVDQLFYRHHYIHGDHHLSNFMFGEEGDVNTIKMIDFGKTIYSTDEKAYQKELDNMALYSIFIQMLIILQKVARHHRIRKIPRKAIEFIRMIHPVLFDQVYDTIFGDIFEDKIKNIPQVSGQE